MIAPIKKPHKKRHPRPPKYRLYQFKITLRETAPPVWRRIQVPETFSFWDFHIAIQDAMGWMDSHLHVFTLLSRKTGKEVRIEIPPEMYGEEDFENSLTDWEEYIADYFTRDNPRAVYEYDFGDSWTHDIEFEGIFPKVPKLKYPKCIGGERCCPPEDCGGTGGYEELLEAMKNPKHPRRKELIEWLGHEYVPDLFKPQHVSFDNPRWRWERAFRREA